MTTTVNDILQLVDDHLSVKAGQLNEERKIRQINRSIEYFRRRIGFPCDEKIQTVWFSDDQFFYDVESDFAEEKALYYNDPNLNRRGNEWEFRPDQELLRRTGNVLENEWSITNLNGKRQLMMLGTNQVKGSTIDDLDTVGDWEVAGDASSLAQDQLEKKQGDGALSFDVINSTGTASIVKDDFSIDVQSLFEKHGYFKFWTFLTDNNIDDIAIKLMVDDSNYWTITETDTDDGLAFAENTWQKIGFPLDDAVKTGTPEIDETVTKIQIDWDLGSGFTTAVDFRADHIFTTIPDKMDFVYWSNSNGTDSSGTAKTRLTATNDIVNISGENDDLDDLIARRAALVLFPGLRADKEWYGAYLQDMKEMLRDYGKQYPRVRVNRMLRTRLKR